MKALANSSGFIGWRSFALAVVVGTVCPPTHATDLLEAFRLAEASDPTFESARYTLEGIRQKIPQARAALLPAANVTANSGNTHAETMFTDVPTVERNMKSWTWSLQLTQPLIRLGSVYAYRESEFLVAQAEAQFTQAKQDLILRVAQAYFGVLIAADAIAAADAQVNALSEQLAQVTHGYGLGTHSVTDVDETKSRLGTARSQRVSAQNDLDNRRADLERVTGLPLDHLSSLQTAVPLPFPAPTNSRAWIDQARIDNPLVRVQRAALAAAQEAVSKNRAEYLPTLDLVASYGSNFASHSLSTPNDYSTRVKSGQAGLQLTVPLSAGGATRSRVSEAVANKKKVEADMEAARRQAATDAQQAFAGVSNGLAQIEALSSAIESAQSAVKGNRVGYHLGIRINIDVLNAEQQLYSAQRDLSKARYETMLQGLKLKAAAGALTVADIVGLNGLLVH